MEFLKVLQEENGECDHLIIFMYLSFNSKNTELHCSHIGHEMVGCSEGWYPFPLQLFSWPFITKRFAISQGG